MDNFLNLFSLSLGVNGELGFFFILGTVESIALFDIIIFYEVQKYEQQNCASVRVT